VRPIKAIKKWRLRKVELDNLPADLYDGFAEERDLLKKRLFKRGRDPGEAWLEVYLAAERLEDDNTWLKTRADIARETMETLLVLLPE